MSNFSGSVEAVSSDVMMTSVNPSAEPHIVVNADRTVTVPEELRRIAVEHDHNVETVTFDCPRHWDEHDLSTMHIYIHYRCADGKAKPYLCKNLVVDSADSGIIHFDWTLSQDATCIMGPLSFLVAAKKPDEEGKLKNYWHSHLNQEMEVLEGLECNTDELVELYPDVIEQILLRLDDVEKNGGGSGGTAEVTAESIKTALGYTPASTDTTDQLNKAIANLGGTLVEPAEDDIPKVFFGGALQQTKDEAVVPFSYRSKTLSFDCYAEIKAQGNSTLSWPKKNQTVKLYANADCSEKLKIDFKGWGKQNKFVIKANWRDLTHVRDIVSVRLEGDCLRSNPDYDTFPELLKTSPNMGGIDGFPVVVYAAGVYQGRYMWNIPKDKWMTNMDDELDEHCILCSEDYNSSCFRKAANINGSDWTDEIHDVVPASIKTRWNEVISFVMNSSDEEFVANLDSYIKVSTLIDRHLMGLLSCDFDGYGKNQLYITYDGQQWYADRYDKDGTWGNYWTGNSMLPSNYGREQYEDMISDRPGNLLFIRLEKLFWERLQSRWAELRVNELSIPNIINRFRELYDITPPYLIEEDYASTTANGAFTGIPNKTTCTIQQIQKFVVERHAWTDAYVAGLTPEIEIPCTGISLDKSSLTFTAEDTQTLTATVIPEGCTDPITWESDNASVATVVGGVVTAIANGSANITVKCGEYSASCAVSVSGIAEPVPCESISLDKTELTFAALNATQTLTATVTPSDTTDKLEWSSDNESVATVKNGVVTSVANGSAVITATCGNQSASCSVTVAKEEVAEYLYRDYSPNGVAFGADEVALDLSAGEYIEAKVDLSECQGTNEYVLSIGNDISQWHGYIGCHVLYTQSTKQCSVHFTYPPRTSANYVFVLDSDNLTIRFDSSGCTVNGVLVNESNLNIGDVFTNAMTSFLEMTSVQVGAKRTPLSYATYEYIKVVRGLAEDPTILYSLPEETTFNGTDTYIDTGVQLFDTAKDFTLAFRGDLSKETNNQRAVFHCQYEESPYPGQGLLSYIYTGNSTYRGEGSNKFPMTMTGYVMTAKAGCVTSVSYIDNGTITHIPITKDYVQFSQNLLIGCYQTTDGTKGRFWTGTMYDFRVHDYEMTTEQIEAYLNG